MIRKSAFALAGAAMMFAAPAFAQNSATATVNVSGNVISALTLGVPTAVTMPTVVKPTSGTSSISLDCSGANSVSTGVATYSVGANPFVHGSASATGIDFANSKNVTNPAPGRQTGTCGSVVVSGEAGYFFLATTSNPVVTTGGANVTAFTGNCTVASTVLPATIYCGASASVNPSIGGSYAGTFDVTVTYD